MPSIISVRNISKSFDTGDGKKTEVINDLSIEIEKGTFLTILGPSGSGKSTLLMMIGGMISPTSGEIYIDDVKITRPRPDKVSIVFQDASLLPWRTALENVEFGLEILGLRKNDRRERARKYLSLVGLSEFENFYPSQLSGGMQQRVSVARALALGTDVILMDEPFGALDEQSRFQLGAMLTEIWRETGKTIVFVTHSIGEAAFLSEKVALISARPAKISQILDIDVPRPRDPEDQRLSKYRMTMWKHISSQTMLQYGLGKPNLKKKLLEEEIGEIKK
ncbi:MAG TPA: ABC transporter ATP-binding protein [Thermoplasmataceae archaeon]|nr:ABC transporter ATP-binding protein [Thermoplasmatales archaeon AK]HLH85809.1 ABC transporter ATP-binding protein [Thermoplasmataceae archaeon]